MKPNFSIKAATLRSPDRPRAGGPSPATLGRMMTKIFWNTVLAIALACIGWGLWILPSPINDWYRYGYIVSGAVCLLAYAAMYFERRRIAATFIFLGSIIYLIFPGRTFAKLIVTGDFDLLRSIINASYNAPTSLGYTTIQALNWRVDLLLFGLTFTIYFLSTILGLLFSQIVRFKLAPHRSA